MSLYCGAALIFSLLWTVWEKETFLGRVVRWQLLFAATISLAAAFFLSGIIHV